MGTLDYILELYAGTPRQGPGSEASTLKALRLARLPGIPEILDVGCGSGAQTLTLLEHTAGNVTAVDISRTFLDRLTSRAAALGYAGRLKAVRRDMAGLRFGAGRFDCVWSEGAAYIVGFKKALSAWRRFLKPGGCLAVSELTLLGSPPEAVTAYWKAAYPEADFAEKKLELARRSGYAPLGHFTLPKSDWLSYYEGLKAAIPGFEARFPGDRAAAALVAGERAEMAFYKKYSDYYGYVFYLLRRQG